MSGVIERRLKWRIAWLGVMSALVAAMIPAWFTYLNGQSDRENARGLAAENRLLQQSLEKLKAEDDLKLEKAKADYSLIGQVLLSSNALITCRNIVNGFRSQNSQTRPAIFQGCTGIIDAEQRRGEIGKACASGEANCKESEEYLPAATGQTGPDQACIYDGGKVGCAGVKVAFRDGIVDHQEVLLDGKKFTVGQFRKGDEGELVDGKPISVLCWATALSKVEEGAITVVSTGCRNWNGGDHHIALRVYYK